jgi:hypothetical protein
MMPPAGGLPEAGDGGPMGNAPGGGFKGGGAVVKAKKNVSSVKPKKKKY